MEKLRKFFEGRHKERLGGLFVIFLIGVLMITVLSNSFTTADVDSGESYIQIQDIPEATGDDYAQALESRLSSILSKVDGAGEVSVMVNLSSSSEIVLSKSISEERDSEEEIGNDGVLKKFVSSSTKEEPIIISGSSGKDTPLILTEKVPKVEGVIIVAEGGGNVHIKDGLIKSVTSVLGVPSHKVQVLKGTSKNLELKQLEEN